MSASGPSGPLVFPMLSKNRKCHDLKIAYGVKGEHMLVAAI